MLTEGGDKIFKLKLPDTKAMAELPIKCQDISKPTPTCLFCMLFHAVRKRLDVDISLVFPCVLTVRKPISHGSRTAICVLCAASNVGSACPSGLLANSSRGGSSQYVDQTTTKLMSKIQM